MRCCKEKWLYLALNLAIVAGQVHSKSSNSEIAEILHRPIRSLAFPDPSNMGIFFALAVPLEEPYKSISLSYFFEANYDLPPNVTYFEPWSLEPVERKKRAERRTIDRSTIYRILESKLESSGYPGRDCLLRVICETSEYPLGHNGVVGDILHVIFTPTTSRLEASLPRDIVEAELLGRNGTCANYVPACPVGLFDLIGVLA